MNDKWVVFDLIGVLAEPSWRETVNNPSIDKWETFRVGKTQEADFWTHATGEVYRKMLRFRSDRLVLVKRLREKGLKVCVATNFSKEWYDTLLAQLDDASLFADRVISAEIGAAKPEGRFFAELQKHVPAGTIFVDDKKYNCDAAEQAGFRSIWAHPGARVEEQIDRLLDS